MTHWFSISSSVSEYGHSMAISINYYYYFSCTYFSVDKLSEVVVDFYTGS